MAGVRVRTASNRARVGLVYPRTANRWDMEIKTIKGRKRQGSPTMDILDDLQGDEEIYGKPNLKPLMGKNLG